MGVLTIEELETMTPLFRGNVGNRLAMRLMQIFGIEKVNQLYDRSGHLTGAEFASSLLRDLGVNYLIGHAERLRRLPEGAFVTVSNHPYGGLDGVITIDLMAGIRSDYKFMVNQILASVKALQENFIPVTPTGNIKNGITAASISGIRETLAHIRSGHPMGFFPSGAVSDLSLRDRCIRDRQWQANVLRVIRSVRVPILPIRFFDVNSIFYYLLGLINWRIRLMRVPWELFNKRSQTHRIGIGNLIPPGKLDEFDDITAMGAFLRKSVYEMPLPDSFIPRSRLHLEIRQPVPEPY